MRKYREPGKMTSESGVILSLTTYPFLIILVIFGLSTFTRSVDTNNQARVHLRAMQAQYEAYMGIEYAYVEIKNRLYSATPFLTHSVNSNDNSLTALSSDAIPAPSVPGTTINNGTYQISGAGSNSFEVKIYSKNADIYILAKGKYNGKNTILVNKMAGSPLYEYFFFFPGNSSFSTETLDAQGGKVHTNGNMLLGEYTKLENVSELTAAGKIYMSYSKHVLPEDVATYPTSRYPWWLPVDSNFYRNRPDGHYTGDLYGLYMDDPTTPSVVDFVAWQSGNSPIPVSIEDTPGTAINPDNPEGDVWGSANYSYIYQQKLDNINCANNIPSTCANGATNNANYNPAFPYINGYYIPNRLPSAASYSIPKYLGNDIPTVSVNLTDSELSPDAWDNFIESLPAEISDTNTVTGLGGAVKAGERNGVDYQSPPRIDMDGLIEAAQSSDGLAIESQEDGSVTVTINGGSPMILSDVNSTAGCTGHTVFTRKAFMNHETALRNDAVEVDLGELIACEEANQNLWVPKNNLLYANTGVVLTNAETLPTNGLTSIVQGNLFLKGEFNTAAGNWQPAAAIVSDYSYLLSNSFNYPQTLPHQQRHSEYPNAGNYDGFTISAGITNYDFTNGYNWLYRHDSEMANKVSTGPIDKTYEYNISLVGKNAYNPRYLERWGYYTNIGNDSIPPDVNSWDEYNAVVTGAFIQLSSEFPEENPLASPVNARNCDSQTSGISTIDVNGTVSFNPANYPCRATDNNFPTELLAWYNNEEKKYEPQFLSSSLRPPGYLSGLQQFAVIEIPDTTVNWAYHNNSIFSIEEESSNGAEEMPI